MSHQAEILEGYVVDIACLRKYPQEELLERARAHTNECAIMGHCLESGYGLVGEDNKLFLLDAKATLMVLDAARSSDHTQDIKLSVKREMNGKEMETKSVEVV